MLSSEKIKALEEGIKGWFWTMKKRTWEETYNILKEYVAETQTLPKYKETYKGVRIGQWCDWQRTSFKKGKLSPEKIKALKGIKGWFWTINRRTWDESYSILKEYVTEKKTLPPCKEIYKGVKIGQWCSTQRAFFKKGKLSQMQINKLKTIPGWKWRYI